jgi:EAL domain-containing protein (putative c-di-GMP-specific phosphodiesterase class I)
MVAQNRPTADKLVRMATEAMITAKKRGRYCIVYSSEDQSSAEDKTRVLLGEIKYGLANDLFSVKYQPKVNLLTGDIVGAEALSRFHREGIKPDDYISLIEFHELNKEFLEYTMRKVFSDMTLMSKNGINNSVAINIFASEINQPLLDLIIECKRIYPDVALGDIEFEILETSRIRDIKRTKNVMSEICDLGPSFSVDDFGTGFSSLDYIKNLPISSIKIDKQFILDLDESKKSQSMVKAIIDMSKNFGIKVVAEGIENQAILSRLISYGCTHGQGFLFSKALSLDDYIHFYENNLTWCAKYR